MNPKKAAKSSAKTFKKPLFPNGKTLQGLGIITAAGLREELEGAGYPFDSKALKADLLPLTALSRLGLAKKGWGLGKTLLEKLTGWCAASAADINDILDDLGLERAKNKWLNVEILIRNE